MRLEGLGRREEMRGGKERGDERRKGEMRGRVERTEVKGKAKTK